MPNLDLFLLVPQDFPLHLEVSTSHSVHVMEVKAPEEKTKNQQKNPANIRDSETTIKITFCVFEGGGSLGAERKIVQKRCFSWETPRQYNFESANFIVVAQAPKIMVKDEDLA